MDRLQTIESLLDLARLERSLPPGTVEHLLPVRERLESSLDGTVRPSEAARLLGVRPPSLKYWLDSGEIPTVLTRQGRRELPVSDLLALVLETEELRKRGHERALSAAVRRRREQASELDVDALLPPRRPRTHRQAELQSLAYHRLIASRLTPERVADALRTLDRWESDGKIDPRWAVEWRQLLARPLPAIRRMIGSDSTRGRELRQTSPFVGAIPEHERRRIIEAVESRR